MNSFLHLFLTIGEFSGWVSHSHSFTQGLIHRHLNLMHVWAVLSLAFARIFMWAGRLGWLEKTSPYFNRGIFHLREWNCWLPALSGHSAAGLQVRSPFNGSVGHPLWEWDPQNKPMFTTRYSALLLSVTNYHVTSHAHQNLLFYCFRLNMKGSLLQ